jgi:glycosyltransferase involved in cell wall biosynthesis
VGVERTRWEGPQTAELARRLRRHKVDRVLANFGPTGVALLPACQKASVPLVVHFHGFDAHTRSVTDHFGEQYRKLGREAAAVIAVSHGMVAALAELGVPREKIHLTRYGVDASRFAAKATFPEVPLFFGVGRFVEKKAPYLTLLAFANARKRLPGAKLVLGGDGELWETTRNMAAALELGESVEFPGVMSPDAVAATMQSATAFVQHSIEPAVGPSAGDREGTPVAVLEALMTGLPVISTRHAGIGEVVEHERTGLLVEERNVDGMAEAMSRVGASQDFAAALGRAARQVALANYGAEHYVGSLKRILDGVE